MTWTPITDVELLELIAQAEQRMTSPQRKLWQLIAVPPVKWSLSPWGDEGGGFWVVAIIGEWCIYYNDIEDGFNRSTYQRYGTISEYWCNQDELNWVISRLCLTIVNA